jgi:hypothetical protein
MRLARGADRAEAFGEYVARVCDSRGARNDMAAENTFDIV